jgi:hypothetical protein
MSAYGWLLGQGRVGGSNLPAWTVVVAVGLSVAGGLIVLVLMRRAERRRMEAIVQVLGSREFDFDSNKDTVRTPAAFQRIAGFESILKTGYQGLRWIGEGGLCDADAVAAEHVFVTGAGKSRRSHPHLIVAMACPLYWGEVTVQRESILTTVGKVFGKKDFDLDNPAFNKKWFVKTSDPDLSLALLSSGVQAFLVEAPVAQRMWHETWLVCAGAVGVVVRGRADADRLKFAMTRMSEFFARLDPELQEQIRASTWSANR